MQMRFAGLFLLTLPLGAQGQPDAAALLYRAEHALASHTTFRFEWRSAFTGDRPGGPKLRSEVSGSAFGRDTGTWRVESSTGTAVINDGKVTWTFHRGPNTYQREAYRASWFQALARAGVQATPAIVQYPTGGVREEKIDVGGETRDCWVVTSVAPSPWNQQTTTWIDKNLWIDWKVVTNGHDAAVGYDLEMTLEKFNLAVDPVLPDSLFSFTPPPDATQEHHEGVH